MSTASIQSDPTSAPEAALVPATPKASPRYPWLDVLRIIAMVDIVAIHGAGSYVIWGAGLPIFILASVALSTRKAELPTTRTVAKQRAQRVLLPWVLWSAFYGYLRVQWAMGPDATWDEAFGSWMFMAGPSAHLWFLPFIFVMEVGAVWLLRRLDELPTKAVAWGFLIAGVLSICLMGCVFNLRETYGDPTQWEAWASWCLGFPSVLLGVGIGRMLSLGGTKPRRVLMAVAAVLFVVVYVVNEVPALTRGHTAWLAWRHLWAFLLVVGALQFVGKTPKWVSAVAGLTMGIYLLHPWVDSQVYALMPHVANISERLTWHAYSFVGQIVWVWCVTAALVALLRLWPKARAVV